MVSASLVALAAGAGVATAGPRSDVEQARSVSLTHRVLREGDLAGFKVIGSPRVAFNATAFAKLYAQPADGPKLARAGFSRGVYQVLQGPKLAAFSLLFEYPSTSAAKSELARFIRQDRMAPGVTAKSLAVPGIAGARGLRSAFKDRSSQAEVLFVDGRYMYYETVVGPPGVEVKTGPLLDAAKKLFVRVRGTGAPESG
jgi:hypothetical protein